MKSIVLAFALLFALTSQPLLGAAEDASSTPEEVLVGPLVSRTSTPEEVVVGTLVNKTSTPEEVVDALGNKTLRGYAIGTIVVGNTGPHTILNGFKIVKYGGGYKLVLCPRGNVLACRNVGVFVDQNLQMHLSLSDVPLKIYFHQHA